MGFNLLTRLHKCRKIFKNNKGLELNDKVEILTYYSNRPSVVAIIFDIFNDVPCGNHTFTLRYEYIQISKCIPYIAEFLICISICITYSIIVYHPIPRHETHLSIYTLIYQCLDQHYHVSESQNIHIPQIHSVYLGIYSFLPKKIVALS